MDPSTLEYYDRNAARVAGRHRAAVAGISQHFPEAFPCPGQRILDVGAGSGRDTAALLTLGQDAYGTEPSAGMRAEAVAAFPHLRDRLFPHALPLPEGAVAEKSYEGILCSAVLMHVPPEQLFDAVFSFRRVLKDRGRLLLSVPEERPGLDTEERDADGRLFHPLPARQLTLLLGGLGFKLLGQWSDADGEGRPGVRWSTLLLELENAPRSNRNGPPS